LQVSSHLNAYLNYVESNELEPKTTREGKGKGRAKESKSHETTASNLQKGPPHVSVAAIVGGMSTQKQRRILDRGVDVLVATPGRLWDIMEEVCLFILILVPFSLIMLVG
jgi:ATP-dependent RNA helicase DDX24/MAK5